MVGLIYVLRFGSGDDAENIFNTHCYDGFCLKGWGREAEGKDEDVDEVDDTLYVLHGDELDLYAD